jgi:hypothetical protein
MNKKAQSLPPDRKPALTESPPSENQSSTPASHPHAVQAFADLAAVTGAQSTFTVLPQDEEDSPPEESEEEKSDQAR